MRWLPSCCPSPAPPDLEQVGSGLLWISCQPALQETPQEAEMLDGDGSHAAPNLSSQVCRSTRYEELQQNTTQKTFAISSC